MIVRCAVCGKKDVVLYPHLWAYKKDGKHFCSWSCMRILEKRKEAEDMAERLKKDGTPAKRPGRKPQEKKAEPVIEKDIEKVYEAEQQEIRKREHKPPITAEEQEEIRRQLRDQEKRFKDEKWRKPLEAASLKSRVLKADYSFDSEDGQMVMRGPDLAMNMIMMTAEEWRHLSAEILVALKQLGMGEDG